MSTVAVRDTVIESGTDAATWTTTDGKNQYYAVAFGDDNGFVSNIGPVSSAVTFTAHNAATLDLSGITVDSNATKWFVYRTPEIDTLADPESAVYSLGLVGEQEISNTTFIDRFDNYDRTEQPLPVYEMYAVEDANSGTTLRFHKFGQPPASLVTAGVYEGHLWCVTSNNPRALYYSVQGNPWYWPEINVITSIPVAERDELVAGDVTGNVLVLAAKEAMFVLRGLPRVRQGILNDTSVTVLGGAPGCVGSYALAKVEIQGIPYVAWVAYNGVYITNGSTYRCISTDIDWESEVSQANLDSAALFWDQDNRILWLHFDSDGGGENDREVAIHLDPSHTKGNGQPKWNQPTSKESVCMAGGLVSGTYRRYSAHPSDGKVYLEESGTSDAATGSAVAMTAKTGRLYLSEGEEVEVRSANLNHTSGGDRTVTVSVTSGNDRNGHEETNNHSVNINSNKGTQFWVSRRGEYFDVQVSDTTAGTWAIEDVKLNVVKSDRAW